jgi:siroheme decarboxylase
LRLYSRKDEALMNFTVTETRILDRIQMDFPSSAEPLRDMAAELDINENDFIISLRKLKEGGIVRGISGIFNAGRLGYSSCLVAFIVEENDIERAASRINAHPGVSHNYLRDNRYNIWFTLAAESEEKLEQTVKILAEICRAKDHLILRNEKLIKIGLMLPIGDAGVTNKAGGKSHHSRQESEVKQASSPMFSDQEKESIRILQMDLPIEMDPFSSLIKSSGCSIDTKMLVQDMINFKNNKILRRYSGVLRHREAGYRFNAMTVWKPGAINELDTISDIFSKEPSISHLYLRTVYPGKWEYPLFAMIHARTGEDLERIISNLAGESGINDYQTLNTVREFKKERVVYFSRKFIEWERQAGV